MRKYEQQALGGALILLGLWLWWNRPDPPDFEYERPENPGGPSDGGDYPPPGDSEWMIKFRKDVAKDRRKTKRYRRETSARRKAWNETMHIWNNPDYVRKHPHVEGAGVNVGRASR